MRRFQSVNGAGVTIIEDILDANAVVTFSSGEGVDSVIDGFTFIDGRYGIFAQTNSSFTVIS
jgi:hypothetical protein